MNRASIGVCVHCRAFAGSRVLCFRVYSLCTKVVLSRTEVSKSLPSYAPLRLGGGSYGLLSAERPKICPVWPAPCSQVAPERRDPDVKELEKLARSA